ncbi:MAG: SIMPL domain-containing protein, partial [Alphaproteobacteria bacterium]|nr:SIMPL domain-containing protein [Alphaproteobacteria bacterium]
VRTDKVDAVADAVSQTNELVAKSIVLENQTAAYFFTKLNEVKPAMLKEATENARQAAHEFAQNSGSKVGKIKTANQGVFSIQPRDDPNAYEPSQINKKVRVVATIDYFLED